LQDWQTSERYLAFSPHPDDAELGCGGTLFRLARQGAAVHLTVVTDGRLGTRDPMLPPEAVARLRREEAAAAAAVLGAELSLFGLPDGGPIEPYDLRDRAVREIRRFRPDYVFVCDPWLRYEAHSDHRAVGLAVSEAALLSGLAHYAPDEQQPWTVKGVLFYFPDRADVLSPLDDDAYAARLRAIACHRSQFSPADPYLERIAEQLKAQGTAAGAPYAEALHFRQRTDLHIPQPSQV
jgi:LmbE family N-acetylglucosaminyl deacetylase